MTTTTTTTNATSLRRKVCILAYQLAKHTDMTSSELMTEAWKQVKANSHEMHILEGTKKDGTPIKRLVYTNWNRYNEVKGTGRPKPEGLILLVDCAKMIAGETYTTISIYEANIKSLAA